MLRARRTYAKEDPDLEWLNVREIFLSIKCWRIMFSSLKAGPRPVIAPAGPGHIAMPVGERRRPVTILASGPPISQDNRKRTKG